MKYYKYVSPPEGDAIRAIRDFRSRLRDPELATEDRLNALRFLVHFVVDLHQPLHVGRATDRGGTMTEVIFDDRIISLHRFWDTEIILEADLSVSRYAERIEPLARLLAAEYQSTSVRDWADEGLALREFVYSYDAAAMRLNENYIQAAGDVVRLRLVQAGLRLADQLNQIFCSGTGSLGP